MSIKGSPFPKALNIIRPSSPLIQQADTSHSTQTTNTTSSSSTISTLSNFSSNSNNNRVQPTIINPSNFAYFQNNWASFKSNNPVANTVGVNPHRFLQRPRSNSNLSKSTFFSNLSISSHGNNSDDDEEDDIEEDDEDEEDDLDSIDGITDDEEEDDDDIDDEEEQVTKVVAKVKHGTIMNGKGEFVNKGSLEDHNTWLDEARANRKIADLEIEKASLLVLNTTLEAKLRQQTSQIVELQKRLQMNDEPLTPVSDKNSLDDLFDDDSTLVSSNEDEEIESDHVFQRIKSMLEGLILQAEVALLQKSKQSGKVLQQDYYFSSIKDEEKKMNVEETLHKLTTTARSVTPDRRRPPIRRVSDASTTTTASMTKSRPTSTKMSRNLSRQSSPPVMVTSTSPRPFSPPPTPTKRSTSPRYSSQLRKNSQDLDKPKWH